MTEEFDIVDTDEIGWTRFLAYGRRIRVYDWSREDPLPSDETLEAIKSRMDTTEITLNLRELRLYVDSIQLIALSSILANGSLEHLALHFCGEAHKTNAAVISNILSQAVQLRRLQISTDLDYDPDLGFLQTLQQAAPKLERLEKVFFEFCKDEMSWCQPIPQLPDIIKSFGSSLPVTQLSMCAYSCATWPTEAGFREGLFWRLTSVDIKANLTSISSCLQNIPRLTTLRAKSLWFEDILTLDKLLTCASMSLPSLWILKIEVTGKDGDSDAEVGEAPLTYTMLGQHSVMHKLWDFEIIWPTLIRGSNNDLSALVSHMPKLYFLSLATSPGSGVAEDVRFESDLTLDILHVIAHCCPNLYELRLVIDNPYEFSYTMHMRVCSFPFQCQWRSGPTSRYYHENYPPKLSKFIRDTSDL